MPKRVPKPPGAPSFESPHALLEHALVALDLAVRAGAVGHGVGGPFAAGAAATPAAPELGHAPILTVRLNDIRPSPENDRLYRPVDPDDPQIIRLAESIRDCGMQEPLLVTRDGWIISSHRRYAAAAIAGLEAVPCRVEPIYKDTDHDTFMMLLRECNRQRVKSFDEKLREEVLSDSADDAYKSLLDLLTRARLAGLVPMGQVADETRPVETWNVHGDVQDYIADEWEIFLRTYRRDLPASQPNHIELVAEKNTVAPVVMPVAQEYCVPTTIGRGYCSLPPRAAMVERYHRSGKEQFILLVVSDFDPDGEEIAHSLARSLRDDFGVDRIEPVKVALTADMKIVALKLARHLGAQGAGDTTIDRAVYWLPRMLRLPDQVNPKTSLYKVELRHCELFQLTTDQIMDLARRPRGSLWSVDDLPNGPVPMAAQ